MTTTARRRLVLLPHRGTARPDRPSAAASSDAALRRYRLARVRVEDPQARRRDPQRFAHLKRAYD